VEEKMTEDENKIVKKVENENENEKKKNLIPDSLRQKRNTQDEADGKRLMETLAKNAKKNNVYGDVLDTKRPGQMKMRSHVKVHSDLAAALFVGRKGDRQKKILPVVGLARFARQVGSIWDAARKDDPYADKVLLDIEKAFNDALAIADKKLKDVKKMVESDMELMIDSDFMESASPTVIEIDFYSPWAFRGLKLLQQYDRLVRMALAGRHIGLFTTEDWRGIVYEVAKPIRHTYIQSNKWVHTGVTRDDIAANNQVARKAKDVYLKKGNAFLIIDADVMKGERRAELAPVIHRESKLSQTPLSNETLADEAVTKENNDAVLKTDVVKINAVKKIKRKSTV